MAKEKRFDEVYSQGSMMNYKIVIDNYTGVQYLYITNSSGVGLTPLLDESGKPIIVPVDGKLSL